MYFQRQYFYDMIRIMKTKIAILSSLLCLCGIPGHASDCIGAGCNIAPIAQPIITDATVVDVITAPSVAPAAMNYAMPAEYVYADQIPMRQMKLLSIKPVPADNRAPVWDGTGNNYKPRGYDKTVDWRDGVPIWDDSIVSYKSKDFSDWFLEPMDELYIRDADVPAMSTTPVEIAREDSMVAIYNQNMADAAATRERIEELLNPKKPSENLWVNTPTLAAPQPTATPSLPAPRPEYTAQDMTQVVQITFGAADGCPFESETECEIWRRKPIVRETVSPRSPKIRTDNMDAFIAAARCNPDITANDPAAAPLLARYKMLMNSANACCTDGMVYSLKRAGASDGLVYKFMADDANFYGFGARCLMMSDTELDTKYPNTATAAVAADVRNGCLCRGRQWFTAMLAPFQQVYQTLPEFANEKFFYTYTDGLQREITVSVNTDIQNVLNQLALCP